MYPNSKLLKITTPGAKRGQVWEEYCRRGALPYYVWQVSTAQLNPSVPRDELERMRQLFPEQYRREFEAEFTDSLNSWLPFQTIISCVIKDRDDLPYMSGLQYSACIDAGFRESDFAMAISHRTESGLIVQDLVRTWTGTSEVPLAFQHVLQEIAAILRRYNITTVVGDQFCEAAIRSELGQMGIRYEVMTFTANTRY